MLVFGSSQDNSLEVRFASSLAAIVFAEDVGPLRAARDAQAAQHFLREFARRRATEPQSLTQWCVEADHAVVRGLSGRYMLEVARGIEQVNPALIDAMPTLTHRAQHLSRVAALARIFDASKLERLAKALESDAD